VRLKREGENQTGRFSAVKTRRGSDDAQPLSKEHSPLEEKDSSAPGEGVLTKEEAYHEGEELKLPLQTAY